MDETKQERRLRQKREASARWAAKNREAARIKSAQWRRDNPEKAKAASERSHEQRKERWAEFLAHERERYRKNPQKRLQRQREAKAADPEKFRKVLRNHYRNNKPHYAAKVAKRRVLRLRATPPWSDAGAIESLYREAQRLTAETGIPHEVDHIIPLAGKTASGLHVAYNMRITTRQDNRRKHNWLLDVSEQQAAD